MNSFLTGIEKTEALEPVLWWLGGGGFVVKYHSIVFYVDPQLPEGLDAAEITHADMILRTHVEPAGADPTEAILQASKRAKVILPKCAGETMHARGIPYTRMTTTDADLRVEYFKQGVYGRVYSVPSSREGLDWTPLGGFPYLGYLIRFAGYTIYHAGSCQMYDGLAERLKPYNVTVALLPIGDRGFKVEQAAQLAHEIQAKWLVPMGSSEEQCDEATLDRFTLHMLGNRPEQPFKIFQPLEGWKIPEDAT
jgi:L-ascorbate metabolism protein UlaG (beta-lactamase superfamily)